MQTLIKSSDSFKSLKQRFDELLKANSQLAETVRSEALKHIELDNLSQNVFTVSKYGIQIQYRNPDGTPLKYKSKKAERIMAARKTVAYNTETEYQFCRYRIAPSLIEAGNFDLKYYSPSKHETGISSAAFFTDTAIQRFKDSKQGGTLFIPEGEKKADALSRYDLAAVGFGGITMFHLDANLMQWIKRCNPDNVALIYDADYYKLGNRNKYSRPAQFLDSAVGFFTEVKQFCKAEGIPVPEFYICAGKDEDTGKGVDDVLKLFPDIALAALNSLHSNLLFKIEHIPSKTVLPSCRAFFGIMADSRKYSDRVFHGNTGEYLTDIAARYGLQFSMFKNKTIISPTGSGKSTLIRSIAAHERIIVAVPTNALQKDFEREAVKHGINCFLFNSDTYSREIRTAIELKSAIVNRLLGNPDKEIINNRFIVVTYKSFHHLVNVLGNATREYNLIIDEAHNFTSSSDLKFMHGNLSSILNNLKKFKSYTLFTATDLPVFAPELQLEKWVFNIPSKIEKNIQFYEKGENQYKTAAAMVKKLSVNGHLPLIVLNSKKDRLIKLKRELKNRKTDFQVFNADTKTESHHSELLSTGKIDTGCMVSTSVIKEGVNIYDTRENVVLIALSEMHAAELEQFAARFRLAKTVTIIILIDSDNVNFDYRFSFANHANIGHKSALAHCELHNQHELSEREFLGKYSEKFTSGDTAVIFNDFTHEWEFCPLLLAHNVFKTESSRQRINPLLMLQYLERYGWKCTDAEHENGRPVSVLIRSFEDSAVNSHPEPEEAKTTKEIFMEALEALEATPDPISIAETGENEFFPLFLATVDCVHTPEQALELFRETEGSTTKINTLKRRLNFKRYLAELTARKKTKGNNQAKDVIKKIVNAFTSSGGLTASQVRELYLATLSGTAFFENRDLQVMRNDRILKNLTRFLEYTTDKEKRNGKTEKVYYFSVVDWL